MDIRILRTITEASDLAEEIARSGRTLALVPTMGYLHEGHLSLMREGTRRADVVVTSLFVNPTQFAASEDLSRYPRDEEGDFAKCQRVGVSAAFSPHAGQMYPPEFETFVEVTGVSQGFCGDRRPGHFRGVATVVAKLLCLFRPRVALFGEKDYQQLLVIRALNRDLNLGVEIIGMPIVREADGLAMSSRNSYLSADERRRATALWRGLRSARDLVRDGTRMAERIKAEVRRELDRAQVKEDYLEVVDAVTLQPLSLVPDAIPCRMLVAGFVGNTRLIDNIALET
jgi:pantoate--beta-alanine ligase